MKAVPQLPLALRYSPDQRFETFVGAPQGALEQLQALATGEAGDRIYLAGAPGTGKTHLALATCAAAGRLGEALEALADARDAGGPSLLALDGLDAIAGNREDEVALFAFHDRARSAGLRVLYVGSVGPDRLPLGLPDLRSRLSQCARIVLAPLDDAGRRQVLLDRARRRGLVLEPAALDWLLVRAGRDLTGLAALLERLDRASLAAQRRITVPFLRQVLEDVRPE